VALSLIWVLSCIPQTRMTESAGESARESKSQTWSTRRDAIDHVARLSLAKVFQEFRKDTSSTGIWSFVHTILPGKMTEPLIFPTRLETRSNLWPNLARENNAAVGLTTTQIDAYERQLGALVGRRNEIAHGKKLVVDSLDEYAEYEKAVMLVLHELAVSVVDTLDKRSFARQSA
jgi:MAE_28990/MAE_18760-like HEPN